MAKILFKSLEVEELLPTQASDENLAKYILNHTTSLLKGEVKIEVKKEVNTNELNMEDAQPIFEQVPVTVTDEKTLLDELIKAFPNESQERITSIMALMLAQSTKDGTFERLQEVLK